MEGPLIWEKGRYFRCIDILLYFYLGNVIHLRELESEAQKPEEDGNERAGKREGGDIDIGILGFYVGRETLERLRYLPERLLFPTHRRYSTSSALPLLLLSPRNKAFLAIFFETEDSQRSDRPSHAYTNSSARVQRKNVSSQLRSLFMQTTNNE